MKTTTLVTSLAMLALSACATDDAGRHGFPPFSRIGMDGYNPLLVKLANPHYPNVSVVDDQVIIDQEPIVIPRGENMVSIEWALDTMSAYSFPDGAIEITPMASFPPPSNLHCGPIAHGKRFVCRYQRSGPAKYAYTIRVSDGSRTLMSDPSIMNR
jgi:hypothetical protein